MMLLDEWLNEEAPGGEAQGLRVFG